MLGAWVSLLAKTENGKACLGIEAAEILTDERENIKVFLRL
jgi:hypothetical protein